MARALPGNEDILKVAPHTSTMAQLADAFDINSSTLYRHLVREGIRTQVGELQQKPAVSADEALKRLAELC